MARMKPGGPGTVNCKVLEMRGFGYILATEMGAAAKPNQATRRNRLKVILIAAGIALALIWHFTIGSRAPQYSGKSISYWFEQASSEQGQFESPSPRQETVLTAFEAMGASAVPYLVGQL